MFRYGNVEYLLQFATENKFKSSTKLIAFADDLLLQTRWERVTEIENIANLESTKITTWAREN